MSRDDLKKTLSLSLVLSLAPAAPVLRADTPLGWISGDMVHAYTQDARTIEITTQALAVNDTIDFLDIREDLLAGTRRLVDDSGDLSGWQGRINVGLLDSLSLFYQRQAQDLTVKIGPVSAINTLDIDQALNTTAQEAGLKWTFYQADFLSPNNAITAASLELAWQDNRTDDFDLVFDAITFTEGGTTVNINFTEPQRAGINNMKDDGWRARLIYSTSPADNMTTSFWAGYSENEATSGTGTSIPTDFIRNPLTRSFTVNENQFQLGIGMNWQLRPRLPIQLSYQYLKISSQDVGIVEAAPAGVLPLPGFLSSSSLGTDDSNHILSGSISWWITPDVNIGLTGKFFSNQFLGVIPHYNNPLSASFSDKPYGYVGIRLGLGF